jgi:hypothetical protein
MLVALEVCHAELSTARKTAAPRRWNPFVTAFAFVSGSPDSDDRLRGDRRVACSNDVPILYILFEDAVGWKNRPLAVDFIVECAIQIWIETSRKTGSPRYRYLPAACRYTFACLAFSVSLKPILNPWFIKRGILFHWPRITREALSGHREGQHSPRRCRR